MRLKNLTGSTALGLATVGLSASVCEPGQWKNLAPIPTVRQEHGTVAVNNHTIAILGGRAPIENTNITTTTDLLQLYDIPSNTWRTGSVLPYKTNHPNVASIGNNIYLLGGLVEGPIIPGVFLNWEASGACHVYNTVTDTWAELPSMPTGTERGSAVVGVHGDLIYLAGGMTIIRDRYQDAVNTVIAFNTTSGTWQRVPSIGGELPESRQHASGTVIGDTFYVIGGRRYGQTDHRDTVFQLNLSNVSAGWHINTNHMPISRGSLNGAKVGTSFYTFGGEGNADTTTGVFNQTQSFDTQLQLWVELGPMAVPRHGTQSVAIGNLIYIPGGGLQQDGKSVTIDGVMTLQQSTDHFDVYCTHE
ncbi:galactose oxidase [Corynespora cassiicola Philippines]|uniref:Galactose oxidase n=1 Tax=Corynespora cassiicola Philippines TaxID=1448308 RepID=A0A2T2N636_CORCC|nr:galactose oxidase [Corynespora cassiicola Philippines]